jgi:hypothetical protein
MVDAGAFTRVIVDLFPLPPFARRSRSEVVRSELAMLGQER